MESRTLWEADFELAFSLSPGGYGDYSLPAVDSSIAFGLLLGRKWSVGLSLPLRLSAWPDGDSALLITPGDLAASVGYTTVLGDTRVRGSFGLTGPTGLWQGNQEHPGSVAGGSGRWICRLSGAVSHIMDPLVLGGLLSWNVGLPREERWGPLWRPGDISLVLSGTEAFNEGVSGTISLVQYVFLPERPWKNSTGTWWGRPASLDIGYDAAVVVHFLFFLQKLTVGIGFSKGLVQGAEPGSINCSVAYILRRGERP